MGVRQPGLALRGLFGPVWAGRDSPLNSGVFYADAGHQWPILNKESSC